MVMYWFVLSRRSPEYWGGILNRSRNQVIGIIVNKKLIALKG